MLPLLVNIDDLVGTPFHGLVKVIGASDPNTLICVNRAKVAIEIPLALVFPVKQFVDRKEYEELEHKFLLSGISLN